MAEPDLDVWPENIDAVELFQRVMTQWNYTATGAPIGLRYEAVAIPLRIHVPRARQGEVLDDLQVMELHAVSKLRANKG